MMKAIFGTDCLHPYSSPFICRYRYSVLLENHSYLMSLQVHGLLHLLGFDHELSEEAEAEMEKEEELLLKSLGWKGKGLIQSAYDAENGAYSHKENTDGNFCLSIICFSVLLRIILQLDFQKTGRKKAVFDFINQSSATSSVIWMVRSRL